MKRISFFAAIVLGIISISACKKQVAVSEGPLTIKFQNRCQDQYISYGQYNYANFAGNQYSINLLKYYVSNVVLIKEDGSEFALNNYDLIDAFNSTNYSTVEAAKVPFGNYTKMRFYLGIDKSRNHSGAQDGDLDPVNNMIWTWATGYLFLKHEGNFINTNGDTVALEYHLGTDAALPTVEIPINLKMQEGVGRMNIQFDLNNMYNNPSIDFNTQAIRHSTSANDSIWITQMKANVDDAFKFISAY